MTESAQHSGRPEVTFYVLASHSTQQREIFACKLIEKIYRSEQNCYVLTDSLEQAGGFDKQLWTFRAGSFIPHQLYRGEVPEFTQTILIGGVDIPENWQNVVLNLSAALPPIGPRSQRILEILDNNETGKQAGRQRYRRYQELGLTITTHKMQT